MVSLTAFVLAPIVGALIGWLTNKVAIYLLFRPLQPLRLIPGTDITFQGLLPKRRDELVQQLASLVQSELLTVETIVENLLPPTVQAKVQQAVIDAVKERVRQRTPAFIPSRFREGLLAALEGPLDKEIGRFFNGHRDSIATAATNELDIKRLVRERLEGFSLEELERLIFQLARRELRHIEVLGGIIGFLVGLAQAALISLLS